MALSKEAVQAAKAQHPEALHLASGSIEVVVRCPVRQEWRRFKKMIGDEEKRADALEQLLIDCTVLPTRDELKAFLEKLPGLAEKFGSKVVQLAGGKEEVQVKNDE